MLAVDRLVDAKRSFHQLYSSLYMEEKVMPRGCLDVSSMLISVWFLVCQSKVHKDRGTGVNG